MSKEYNGEHEKINSPLSNSEKKIIKLIIPKIPRWIQSYHLTLMTIIWSVLIISFSFLAKIDIKWLWAVSLIIILQYATDILDGSLGKDRKMGLIKWGYYMDHFLDYIFLCSLLIGYSFIVDYHYRYLLFFILAVFGGFMVNSFLKFSVTGKFEITYFGIGPTEIRLVFIILNIMLISLGKTYMGATLPYVLALSFLVLVVIVYQTQKEIWKIDKKQNLDKKK